MFRLCWPVASLLRRLEWVGDACVNADLVTPLIFPDFATVLVYISASGRWIFFIFCVLAKINLKRLSFKLKKNSVGEKKS